MKRRLKYIGLGAIGGALLVVALLWWSVGHRPGWYRPLQLTRGEAEIVRAELEQTFELVTQRMVARQPFVISFSARQLNEVIAAQRLVWPAATQGLTPPWSRPCIQLDDRTVQLGVQFEQDNLSSILSVRLRAHVDRDDVVLAADAAHAGALPLPAAVLRRAGSATGGPPPRGHDDVDLEQLVWSLLIDREAVRFPNQFTWPNGEIPFRIDAIDMEPDRLRLHVRPMLW